MRLFTGKARSEDTLTLQQGTIYLFSCSHPIFSDAPSCEESHPVSCILPPDLELKPDQRASSAASLGSLLGL